MDIGKFEADLRDLMGSPFHDRPFMCDGSPLDCQVFIAGINAASSMTEDFWEFWLPGYGFDKAAWYSAYQATRAKPSRTRTVMKIVMDEAVGANSDVRFLETNIYSFPTARENMLRSQQKSTKIFDFLLETIKPQVMLVHGAKPNKYLREYGHRNARVIESPHFIYLGRERAREHGREIARSLNQSASLS